MKDQSNYPQSNSEKSTKQQQAVVDLMHKIENIDENCYSCEEAFALLDEYVERVASEEEAEQIMPLVKNHIDRCTGCQDVYNMLMYILKTEPKET